MEKTRKTVKKCRGNCPKRKAGRLTGLVVAICFFLTACTDRTDVPDPEQMVDKPSHVRSSTEQVEDSVLPGASESEASEDSGTEGSDLKKGDSGSGEIPKGVGTASDTNLLHPLLTTRYQHYINASGSLRLMDASWDCLELDETDAKKYPALAAALKDKFSAEEASLLGDAAEYAGYAQETADDFGIESGTVYEIKEEIKVLRCDETVFSFVNHYYEYTGGVHGMYGYGGYSYDTATGRLLGIDDVFTDREALAEAVCASLQASYDEDVLLAPEYVREYVEECIKDDVLDFVLAGCGAKVYFNPYTIGSYADGVFLAELSPKEYPELFHPAYAQVPESYIVKVEKDGNWKEDVNGDGSPEKIFYRENRNYYEEYGYGIWEVESLSVYVDDEVLTIPIGAAIGFTSDDQSSEAYFIKKDNKCYLYIFCYCETAEGYPSLYVAELTGGKPELRLDEEDAGFSPAYVDWDWDYNEELLIDSGYTRSYALTDPDHMQIAKRTWVFGTAGGTCLMRVGEDGIPVPKDGDEYYRIDNPYMTFTAIQDVTAKRIGPTGEEIGELLIREGETVRYIGTDGKSIADLETESGDVARLTIQIGEVDGTPLEELFDGVVFAG